MAIPRISFLFFCIFASFYLSASARFESNAYASCPADANFTENSIYGANLNNLLSNLSSVIQTDHSGFYNLSYGQNPDKVEAIALCRGDVGQGSCQNCIKDATETLTTSICPNQKKAIIWEVECMLRYSNESILNKLDTSPESSFAANTGKNVSNPNVFNQVITNLLNDLKGQAASGSSQLKFAMGSANVSDSEDVYAFMQCTPDLTEAQCNECLSNVTETFVDFCFGKQDCNVFTVSCVLRSELSITASPPPLSDTATRKERIGIFWNFLAILVAMIFYFRP